MSRGYRSHLVFSGIIVWSMAIFRVSDGGSITWFDPPPFETVTDSAIISAVNKTLIRGFPDEELSCNFSLTADLSLITVSMKYGASTIATYLQSQQALSVDPTFVSRLNATWVPNKLTLILFSVTDAGKGEYRCEVVTYAGSVQTWVRKIQVSLVESSVERGLSVNKEMEIKNLKEQTLNSSIQGTSRYENYLEDERRKKRTEQEQWKGKSVLEVIEEMKKKKARVGSDIKSLNETGNELCVKAEATDKLAFVTQADSLPSIITKITGKTVKERWNVTLKCLADGTPPIRITWTRLSDNTTVTMPLINISRHDVRDYRCTADNGVGNPATRDVSIDVQCK
ncbi:hypothetical protein P5673_032806 [Acropora cervicornis]|uniref:Ig-like domain-containing protein n=1 Tax=Acropora cervicornis TaxID=6130 RepID=A0AAD9URK0_ACRCE|nr:hypothetical protein P5673_032806 [Acropora cervicornis]